MKLISHVKIKTRILILVIIPLIAIYFLAYERYKNASAEVENVKQLEVLQQYINYLSPLTTAMQHERLYSKLYMGPNPNSPVGLEHKDSVLDSRVDTDASLKAYLEFAADRERFETFPTLLSDIDKVVAQFEQLEKMRSLVDKRLKNMDDPEKPGRKLWVNAYYNLTIKLLNESTKQVILLTATNDKLSLLANAYQNATYAQDTVTRQTIAVHFAITRGMVTVAFGDIMVYRALEDTYITNLQTFASAKTKAYLGEHLLQLTSYRDAQKKYFDIRKNYKSIIDKPFDMDEGEWLTIGSEMRDGYTKVINHLLEELISTKNQLMQDAQREVRNTILLLVALMIVLLAVSVHIISSINRPLKILMRDLSSLAETKDMTIRTSLKGKNELGMVGRAFNVLITAFESTLLKVRAEVLEMDETTTNVSRLMDESMKLIEDQREATDSISVAINEMTETIYEVSKMSTSTSDTVQRAHDLSVTSEQDAKTSKNSMDELFEELGDTSQLVSNLNEEANQISNILQVIKGISEQTNLLALNAAIEAARAGEMGRGFAVVADEVRELSRRTHESTDQIQTQIENLIAGADAASKKMDTLRNNGMSTVETVSKSTQAFVTIKEELDEITNMASQIAVGAEQQTKVADEINRRIHQIRDDSEIMHDKGSETLSSTQRLLKTGHELKEDIEQFHF